MQPLHQLQQARTQLQQVVGSRKRKLAVLYSATASDSHDDYAAKLQAFQDANDIERNRPFHENTLPPRAPITRQRRKQLASQTASDTTSLCPTPQRPLSPAKPDSLPTPKPTQKSRGHISGRSSPLPRPQDGHEAPEDDRNGLGIAAQPGTAEGVPTPRIVAGDEPFESVNGESESTKRSRSPKMLHKRVHSPARAQSADTSDKDSSTTGQAATASLNPATDRRSRSPLVLAPVSNVTDPQSSPASTNDHGSANTPMATAGSPTTSPDDEEPGVPRKAAADGNKGLNIPKQPDTPDSTVQSPESSAMDVDVAEQAENRTPAKSLQPPTQEHGSQAEIEVASPKPSMKIDTQTNIGSFFKPISSNAMVESPAPITATATPRRAPPQTPAGQDTSKRATRISSGVLQKKSVSEILGETPRGASQDSPSSMESAVGSDGQNRNADLDRRDKERSKLSTVVFAKPQKGPDGDTIEVAGHDAQSPQFVSPSQQDYMYTLFENKAHSMTRQGALPYLIQNAHKTLSTTDHLVDYQMQTDCRMLKRLYQLQEKNRWPLRQHKRAEEPPRPTSHWDFLLDHIKWLRTDFREERKWKLAAARGLAEDCANWVASSPEERKQLQVKICQPRARSADSQDRDVEMEDGPGPALSAHPTPDLIPSREEDSLSEDIPDPRDLSAIAPAAIFSLGASDINFAVAKTPAFEKLLNELPLYEPAGLDTDLSASKLADKLDSRWKTDVVPVSRFATEKLQIKDDKLRKKKSRYDYSVESSPPRKAEPLPPKEKNVALFMPENKHIRDRIHPGHSFRPPSEHPMPTQAFFETRSSSQWTHAEDDELRRLVKDYSYNWSLISSCLTPRSLYTSGSDRRTPWECFERWIGLEGLPADMSKTPYFKTYSGRIEAAGRHVAAQIEEAQRRVGANVQIPQRKRTTQPVRVDRKRTQRHLAMLDVMRKLAKKRETAAQKQQHQADLAAMRKASEVNQPKVPFKKPQEFAALRQERDQKRVEQAQIYHQQVLAHQRAAAQAQRGQNNQANGMTNGMPVAANGIRGQSGGMPGMPNGNLQVPNGHPRPMPQMMGMPMAALPPNMTPQQIATMQAQMQAKLARGATSPEQMRIMAEATKVQQDQLMRQARQQAQQNGVHSSPNGPHANLANSRPVSNAGYGIGVANGAASPSGNVNGNASSPRSSSSNTGQALSSGHIPVLTQIANKIRESHPNMPEEEVQRHASQQITAWQQQATAAAAGQNVKRQNQAALNAAMGAANAAAHGSNMAASQYPMMTNEQVQAFQQQQQRMRIQQAQLQAQMQAQQQRQQGMQMPPGMGQQAGMLNSPVMNMVRPVSQQGMNGGQGQGGQMSRSVTPRDQRSGSLSAAPGGSSGSNGPAGSPRPGSARAMQT